jgi:hypothetical protein
MKTWTHPQKIRARADTILSLGPVAGQYWSMAGLCDGPGCEVVQVLRAGIIGPEQFHGVEIQRDIYDANRAAWPHLHWHCGDFLQVMRDCGDFHPGLVNADTMNMIDTAANRVARLLYLLVPHPQATLVVNLVMEHRGHCTTADEVIDQLMEQPLFQYAVNRGWSHDGRCYHYPGARPRPRTVMGTFVFRHRENRQ